MKFKHKQPLFTVFFKSIYLIADAALAMHNGDDSDSEVDEQPAYDGYTLLGQHEQLVGVPLADNDDVLV